MRFVCAALSSWSFLKAKATISLVRSRYTNILADTEPGSARACSTSYSSYSCCPRILSLSSSVAQGARVILFYHAGVCCGSIVSRKYSASPRCVRIILLIPSSSKESGMKKG